MTDLLVQPSVAGKPAFEQDRLTGTLLAETNSNTGGTISDLDPNFTHRNLFNT